MPAPGQVVEPCETPSCPCYGTERSCNRCHGRGYYPELYGEPDDWGVQDYRERYCDCVSGKLRREREK